MPESESVRETEENGEVLARRRQEPLPGGSSSTRTHGSTPHAVCVCVFLLCQSRHGAPTRAPPKGISRPSQWRFSTARSVQ